MRCKKNGLAVVIGTTHNPQIIGRECTTVDLAPNTEFLLPDGIWHPAPITNRAWIVKYRYEVKYSFCSSVWGVVNEIHLMPIEGLPMEEET